MCKCHTKIFFLKKMQFSFFLTYVRESIVFESNFRYWDFDGFVRFEVSWIMKIMKIIIIITHFWRLVWVRVCDQHNSISNYSRNFNFGILHTYHSRCCLKLFIKIRLIVCTQRRTKKFKYVTVWERNFLFVYFTIFRLH